MKRILDEKSEKSAHYPPWNWWPNKLRPYESPLGFFVNYCALNGIKYANIDKYFKFNDYDTSLSEKCKVISDATGEPIQVIQSMYDTACDLGSYGDYGTSRRRSEKYCPRCVEVGYHSHLHSISWLEKCPFHLCNLLYLPSLNGNNETNLSKLFKNHCPGWPQSDLADPAIFKNDKAKLLIAWSRRAQREVCKLLEGEIYSNKFYENKGASFVFGRLCCIEEIPEKLRVLTIETKDWTLEKTVLPKKCFIEIQRVCSREPFNYLYEFYKTVTAHSDRKKTYLKKLYSMLIELEQTHGAEEDEYGPDHMWWSIWRSSSCPLKLRLAGKCFHEFIYEDLVFGWGNIDDLNLGNPKMTRHRDRFIEQARSFHKFKVVSYKPGYRASGETLGYDCDILHSCDWKNSALAKVFDALAECELDIAFRSGMDRINSHDVGHPYVRALSFSGSVRLSMVDQKLTVLNWQTK